MQLEIHKPELERRMRRQIESGHFHDVDERIEKALDALDERAATTPASSPVSAGERRRAAGRKSLVEVFAPLRGLNLDFSRNKFTGRPIDFS